MASGHDPRIETHAPPKYSGPSDRGWERHGPGGGGGLFHPTVSPHDPRVIAVACDMTGSYVTRDGGSRWSMFNLGSRVRCFRFSPREPTVLYAGSYALWRSGDLGTSWEIVYPSPAASPVEHLVGDEADRFLTSSDNWPGGEIKAVAVDPADESRLFLAIGPTPRDALGGRVTGILIYGSRDRGARWEPVTQVPGASCLLLEVDPATPSGSRRLVCVTDAGLTSIPESAGAHMDAPVMPEGQHSIGAAAAGFARDGTGRIYLVTPGWDDSARDGSRLWISTGPGKAFRESAKLDFFELGEGAGRARFRAVACPVNEPETAYLSVCRKSRTTVGETTHAGIYRTANCGESWEEVLHSSWGAADRESPRYSADWLTRTWGSGWGGQALFLGCAPGDARVCVATDTGRCYSTDDGGAGWEQLICDLNEAGAARTRGLDVTTCYGLHFDPFNPERALLSSTDVGLLRTSDGADRWSPCGKGIPREWSNTCYWAAYDPDVEGKVWTAWGSAHDLPRLKMLRADMTRWRGGVAVSTDGGASFEPSGSGLPEGACTQVVMDPGSPPGRRRLYAVIFGRGVYRSDDDGRTWLERSAGTPESNRNCWRLVRSPTGRLHCVVHRAMAADGSELPGGVFVSDDRAETWERLDVSSEIPAPSDLAVSPLDPYELYLAGWPCTVGGREAYGGLWRSYDRGATFARTSLPARYVYSVSYLDEGHTVYAATFRRGVFRSTDGGESWKRLAGADFKWPHRVFQDPFDLNRIYLTTFGAGLWRGPARGSTDVPWELGP